MMNAETREALRTINREFYDRFATAFSASRQRPWPGWERVIEHLTPNGGERAVLDVGCGNGRFGAYLAATLSDRSRYVGLDHCAALLQVAQERLGAGEHCDLRRLDVLDTDLERALAGERFDLVVLFGVLHHLPGSAARRRLLRRLGTRLAPGGVLAASIWRLDRGPRFARLLVPWEDYDLSRRRRGQKPLDAGHLESGDALLGWGGDSEHPRYCHFPGEAEIETWVETPGVPLIDRFEADGPSGSDNLYLVFRASATLASR